MHRVQAVENGEIPVQRKPRIRRGAELLHGQVRLCAAVLKDDLPVFEGSLTGDFPSRANRLGVKGSGQAGAIAAPATIMNAVMNALTPLGVRHLDMPATPSRIWYAIQAAASPR